MEELLLLLIPVSAALGWLAARKYYLGNPLAANTRYFRHVYSQGLNYLLSERTDKAIDAFADLLAADYENIETHIALGNLFRRRGEIEKAIEIHEALIAKDNLNAQQHDSAHFELGLDYLRAGLFDRAESIFQNLSDHAGTRKAALQQLLEIYQHEKEWGKAIACVRKLQELGKLPKGETAAQFLCELAQESLCSGNSEETRQLLEQALADDPRCVRASLLLAKLFMREGRYDAAIVALKRIESQNPSLIPEIIDSLRICHGRLENPASELTGYLGYCYERYGFESAALTLAEKIRDQEGSSKAIEHLLRVLDGRPTLKTINALTGLMLAENLENQRDPLIRLDRALDKLSGLSPRYVCVNCGFSGNELHWRCPSCRHWESTKPV